MMAQVSLSLASTVGLLVKDEADGALLVCGDGPGLQLRVRDSEVKVGHATERTAASLEPGAANLGDLR